MDVSAKISKLIKQLYPSGRAFKMPKDGDNEKLTNILSSIVTIASNDQNEILDSLLPDNDNFSTTDAANWERRLSIKTTSTASLDSRKVAILAKLNYPGEIKVRQNYRFIESQLQDAGFDVYIFENRFDDGSGNLITKTPVQFSNTTYALADIAQYGDIQYGEQSQYGGGFGNQVANSIEQLDDDLHNLGGNLKNTFFIGAQVAGDYADIPTEKKEELRTLILKLKPLQTVAFLLINYT